MGKVEALLQALVCAWASRKGGTGRAACKCANCAVVEFQNILCGGKKIKKIGSA